MGSTPLNIEDPTFIENWQSEEKFYHDVTVDLQGDFTIVCVNKGIKGSSFKSEAKFFSYQDSTYAMGGKVGKVELKWADLTSSVDDPWNEQLHKHCSKKNVNFRVILEFASLDTSSRKNDDRRNKKSLEYYSLRGSEVISLIMCAYIYIILSFNYLQIYTGF
jgi:hypothetical protein